VSLAGHHLLHLTELRAVYHIESIFGVAEMVLGLNTMLIFVQPIDQAG
jgi:hypothetical protein